MTEINERYFCCAEQVCGAALDGDALSEICEGCPQKKHKWPTFPQFEREYGRTVQRGDAIYVHNSSYEWYGNFYNEDGIHDWVVACTPYGKPPDNWRPKK